ncbi:GntR family transcriptional regulator [Pelagibius sp. Alg239-R121]|uniref:GntR family transcriptional regulator n=1 Tax=Pelagibius sp. Alg239-R121 TaxID=2993448 RepID=UPI0024A6CA46|nr:GntR family transcriptional regulator [Pelagibius sp. Alg239-R121]
MTIISNERDGFRVTRAIRESILRLELRPSEVLDEAELATTMGVSRTPIREAIIQLIADGLVVRDGRKAKVAPLDFDDVPKLYDALLISSRMVHRLAAEHRTRQDLDSIKAQMQQFERSIVEGNGVLRSEANHAFHKCISAAGKNRYFSDFYDNTLLSTIRLARACFADPSEASENEGTDVLKKHLEETARQHRQIFLAIESQDIEQADGLAVIHHQLTRDRIKSVLFARSESLSGELDLSLA